MDRAKLAAAFNEWLRRYTENPAQYAREFHVVQTFLAQTADGVTPSYGDECVAYLFQILDEQAHEEQAWENEGGAAL